jgi:hypothetical protein
VKRKHEITVKESALLAGICYGGIISLANRGRIASRKVRGQRLIDARTLRAYIDQRAAGDIALQYGIDRLLQEVKA